MKENDAQFMQYMLTYFNVGHVYDALHHVEHMGMNMNDSRFKKILEKSSYQERISVWMGKWYLPVLEATYNKKPIKEVFNIWRKTKAQYQGKAKMPNRQYDNKVLKASQVAYAAWAHGWRANADWNTCK